MVKQATQDRIEIIEAAKDIQHDVLSAAYQFTEHMGQRKGQALMNGLRHQAPELYEIITGTQFDCFYDDAKVPATIKELGFTRGLY